MKSELNDPAVKAAIAQLDLKPGANGQQAVPVGSRQRVVETTSEPLAPVKKKKFSVELTAEQEARCLREATIKGMSAKEYLQSLVDSKLETDIGRKLIGGSSFMSNGGAKVMAPTRSFGRDI